MTTGFPSTGAGQDVLVSLLAELEDAADRAEVVERYCRLHPEHADDIRAFVAAQDVFAHSVEPPKAAALDSLGDFHIIRELGRGGMGVVYEAVQKPFGRRVAVKTIRDDHVHVSAEYRDRFLSEQKVLARLHHTHIVPIYAAGQSGTLHYFAMPYIGGASLNLVIESAWRYETTERDHDTPSVSKLAEVPSTDAGDASPIPPRQPADSSATPAPPPLRLTLSAVYLRSVAQVMADAADAIQHAHDAKILHRDLKPNNLMVDRDEHCWVLDFGLARFRESSAADAQPDRAAESLASGKMGTPLYMAPEQFDCRADERSDVWGLGVTLYELLTLRRAFDSPKHIPTVEPRPMRELVTRSSRDLEAICRKAIRKEPSQRYQTAREFADDLRRWLRHEPVSSRPAAAPRRAALWSRRNKGWAAAILFAAFAVIALGSAGVAMGYQERRMLLRQRRETWMEQILRIRLTPHAAGWAADGMGDVRLAARLGRDSQLQSQATGLLTGLDAEKVKEFPEAATRVVFDRDGKRLAIVGDGTGLSVWDRDADRASILERAHESVDPVAFRPDGALVRIARKQELTGEEAFSHLRDVTNDRDGRPLAIPYKAGQFATGGYVISPDASLVAGIVTSTELSPQVFIWKAETGEIVKRFPHLARVLRFSPDSRLLAVGDESGKVDLWSIPEGRKLSSLPAGQNPISSLAFSRNHWRRGGRASETAGWMLAAGEQGGTIRIWELQNNQIWAVCHGSEHDVFALEFSPDGTVLASAGRAFPKLWDVATGKSLLDLGFRNSMRSLAFAPDGLHLAVSSVEVFGPGGVDVWKLENGRGTTTYRGLTAQLAQTFLSPDGRLVAGISMDWRVAIWDRATGQLRRMLDVPRGNVTADNSTLAFSPDGKRVAFSAGTKAKLWDIESGQELDDWTLPPGFVDTLAFAGPNRLLSFRGEVEGGKFPPYSSQGRNLPRVCPLRELRPGGKVETIKVIRDFPLDLRHAVASPAGDCFIVDGSTIVGRKPARSIRAYDGSGKELWSKPSDLDVNSGSYLQLDPGGTIALFHLGADKLHLVGSATGALIRDQPFGLTCVGPGGESWMTVGGEAPFGVGAHRLDRPDPLVTILPPASLAGPHHEFSRDGRFLAWGSVDGTVCVADLVEMNRRLTAVGLGW